MGRWEDIAVWQGPAADNFGDGDWAEGEPADRMTGHRGLVLHIAEGTYTGTISWEKNSGSDISSHWVLAKDGRCAQLVDTDDRPWTQGDGNSEWLSIECEGYSGNSLTGAQITVLAQLLARAHQVYGVPLQLADSASGYGLGWHGMGGADWGGHYSCPGNAILVQRPEIISLATEIVNGGTMALTADQARQIQAIDNAWYQTATDQDVISYPNPQGGTGTVTNQLKHRTELIRSQLAAIAADVTELKTRPAATVVLTESDRIAIGVSAGDQAATVVGTQLANLAGQVAELKTMVAAISSVLATVGVALTDLNP